MCIIHKWHTLVTEYVPELPTIMHLAYFITPEETALGYHVYDEIIMPKM